MINPLRNDPCPCGSGLKYKKCCLKKAPANSKFQPRSRMEFEPKRSRKCPKKILKKLSVFFNPAWNLHLNVIKFSKL